MTPGATDGQRGNGKGNENALLSDYVLPGVVRSNMRDASTLGGSLSGLPALNAEASGQPLDAASHKAELETLRLRLTAQQATDHSFAEANDTLIANEEAMSQDDIESYSQSTKSSCKRQRMKTVNVEPRGGKAPSSRPELV